MCLVVFSWKNHPRFPLLLASNRDEFFDRPTVALHQWDSGIYAGKDLRGEGTWLGFHPSGRWALLTNFRDFEKEKREKISRGRLVRDFLETDCPPEQYLSQIENHRDQYEGFNLLVSDGNRLFYLSNYQNRIQEVQPGIHGLSNGLLDEPWPKVELAKTQLRELLHQAIHPDHLLQLLRSTTRYPLEKLPQTGAPPDLEQALSAQMIRVNATYGTVSSNAILLDKTGRVQLKERRFDWDYTNFTDIAMEFQLEKTPSGYR